MLKVRLTIPPAFALFIVKTDKTMFSILFAHIIGFKKRSHIFLSTIRGIEDTTLRFPVRHKNKETEWHRASIEEAFKQPEVTVINRRSMKRFQYNGRHEIV